MSRALVPGAGLVLVYALTLSSSDPLDLAMGAVIAALLLAGLAGRLRAGAREEGPGLVTRIVWFPVFAAAVLADIVIGTWDVALRVMHVRPADRPGLVRVPIGSRSTRGVAVSALATTLSPGTVLVDVDWPRREMLIHVLDASDPDEVRERLGRFYHRYQRRVFP
jgi:multicomponent Na+:H+ antiporter subunit E